MQIVDRLVVLDEQRQPQHISEPACVGVQKIRSRSRICRARFVFVGYPHRHPLVCDPSKDQLAMLKDSVSDIYKDGKLGVAGTISVRGGE
jgi:hypothetical protein